MISIFYQTKLAYRVNTQKEKGHAFLFLRLLLVSSTMDVPRETMSSSPKPLVNVSRGTFSNGAFFENQQAGFLTVVTGDPDLIDEGKIAMGRVCRHIFFRAFF